MLLIKIGIKENEAVFLYRYTAFNNLLRKMRHRKNTKGDMKFGYDVCVSVRNVWFKAICYH